jgi:hypothetical protein
MSTSTVQAANRALQKLGAGRIESLTQDHPNARSMNAVFAPVRDAELRKYAWSFAIKRASIAADVDGPTWGDWNRYSLPNDFICLVRDNESGRTVDWKIEGQYILSADASPLEIRYIARITDTNVWDTLFFEAFAAKLALETCEEITQSTSKKESIKRDYDEAIAEARRLGAIEKEAQESPEDAWLDARL